jgi:hypothetical protein
MVPVLADQVFHEKSPWTLCVEKKHYIRKFLKRKAGPGRQKNGFFPTCRCILATDPAVCTPAATIFFFLAGTP